MADNLTTTLGVGGPPIATNEIGGVHFPRNKIGFGGAGAYTEVSAADPMPVVGPLTNTQLRASPVPVSGALTDLELRALPVAISGALTDTQLRASALPVTGTVTANAGSGTMAVSAASLPLPSGAATEATLAALSAKVPAQGQALMAASQPVVIASNQSAIPIVESATVITGQAAQTAIINNILPATAGAAGTPIADLRAASVQVVSTGTAGTFIFEQSNDDVNYIALPVFNSALTTAVPITAAITATASAIIYTIPLRCRFLRLRIVSTITGGSLQAFSRLSSEPWTPTVQAVAQPTAASLQATVSGTVTANIGTGALAAGTNAIGDVGIQYRANATGAATALNIVSAATTNATVVKASAGRLLGFCLTNNATAVRYLKIHNQTTAPTAGTGVVQTYGIPPNGGTITLSVPGGVALTTGIGLTIVTGAAATDATAVALNDVVGTVHFA